MVSISETQRKRENIFQLKVSKHLLYLKGTDNNQFSDVRFLVSSDIVGDIKSFCFIESSYNQIMQKYTLKLILIYVPTSKSSGEEIEESYNISCIPLFGWVTLT